MTRRRLRRILRHHRQLSDEDADQSRLQLDQVPLDDLRQRLLRPLLAVSQLQPELQAGPRTGDAAPLRLLFAHSPAAVLLRQSRGVRFPDP